MQSVVRKTQLPPTAIAVAATLGTRLAVLAIGALVVTLFGTIPPSAGEALWRVSSSDLANMLARWDTFFYYTIATAGYHWDSTVFLHQDVVFFPLYPMLMRAGGALLGGHPLAAGVIVSLSAFTGAMILLYRLARLDVGEEYAWRVILLIAAFPFALFYSVVYTESLFLLLSVGAFYAMRRGRLGWVAICGLAAGITRPNGFWLALPLACLALWPRPGEASSQRPGGISARTALPLVVSCAPIVGLIIFSIYLQVRFGDALAWLHGQAAWGAPLLGRGPAPDPPRPAGESWVKPTEVVVYIGDIVAFLVAAALIRPITKRFGAAYGVWIAVNIFPPVAAHLFISLGRFTSVLFPLFFWMAVRIPRERVWRVAWVFAAGQGLFAAWFFLWRPVV